MNGLKKAITVVSLTLSFGIAYGQVSQTQKDSTTNLKQVDIVLKLTTIEYKQGKTVVNVDASVTNAGATVLEVLEKSPGITVDRNGGITMQGKPSVIVMIDDKLTYLTGADLNNFLSSMNSSQVSQIELISSPSAKYDAAGNAGIINIKTKKVIQQGFNGIFNTSIGIGVYPKNTNGLTLNYRIGKVNTFFNYNATLLRYLTDLYAFRKYYDTTRNVIAQVDQPGGYKGNLYNNSIKTGLDYTVNERTTIGFAIGGMAVSRVGGNIGMANWLNRSGIADSSIYTTNYTNNQLRNASANIYIRQVVSSNHDISADLDFLRYSTQNGQDYTNQLLMPSGYVERSRGYIPTGIYILSAKIDHDWKINKDITFQSGWKSSLNKTDNIASYQTLIDNNWIDDDARNNHFLYRENVHAIYSSVEKKQARITYQLGLRYELTDYSAHQFGNALQPDSTFSKQYAGFFPSGYIAYQVDSLSSLTLSIGRRIDRPIFQNLNPFLSIVNKYTYVTGNPYIKPQYTWNFELSHQYKSWLTSTLSYSVIKNYFSQIFLNGASKNIILYTQGNVGQANILGLSTTVVLSPLKWWSFTGQALFNYKQLKGFNGNTYTTGINQLNLNINNQFSLGQYSAEIAGFYTTKARNDVQELLYPTGQLSTGISKPIFNKRATLKFTARDIFYTSAMEGLTEFPNSSEYFVLRRDSRVFTLSITFRFGKAFKTNLHSGGAAEEMQRAGG